MQSWKLATSRRTGVHDIAPASDGRVWFSGQVSEWTSNAVFSFDPRTEHITVIRTA